ncbi:dipeptide epimerase [Tunicatimonas pelagia]|uniref:dipeptide epimerase n=1 Tax=Tunicatimonas pelagia TaxID=931531 RepID=UPI00266512A4|nr:dipeptide epimerase [Tunicatimonas pelagia]WKN45886.1 dipeptide epimerase [Tunicatimonas pelagia]
MNISLHPFTLKLKDPFRISYESRDEQEALVIQLSDTDKQGKPIVGLGESTANNYYQVFVEQMQDEVESVREIIEKYSLSAEPLEAGKMGTPEYFWQQLAPHLQQSPFTLCALDIAAHDLYGKKIGQPLYQLWGLNPANAPTTNYTIGIDSIEVMVRKMRAKPWPIYKIKLGTSEDLAIVQELRKHTDAVFRVDANCAWGVREAIENSRELKKLGVEFIEQPLKANNWDGMKEVYQHSALPLMADESCIVESDVAKCEGYFHGINIKLTKCGGITPARRMIQEARQRNMKLMVGCMTESTVGISAIAHLSPLLDYVDMDGAMLLAEDIATGIIITPDGVQFPDENGTGVQLSALSNLSSI